SVPDPSLVRVAELEVEARADERHYPAPGGDGGGEEAKAASACTCDQVHVCTSFPVTTLMPERAPADTQLWSATQEAPRPRCRATISSCSCAGKTARTSSTSSASNSALAK